MAEVLTNIPERLIPHRWATFFTQTFRVRVHRGTGRGVNFATVCYHVSEWGNHNWNRHWKISVENQCPIREIVSFSHAVAMWQTHRLCLGTLGFVDHDIQCCCGIVCHLDTANFPRNRRGWCIIQVNSTSRTYERRTRLPSTRFFLFFNFLLRRIRWITQVSIWESHSLAKRVTSYCWKFRRSESFTKCFPHSPSFWRAQKFLLNDRYIFPDAKTTRNLGHGCGVHAEDSPRGRWAQVGAKRHEQQNVHRQRSTDKGISHRSLIIRYAVERFLANDDLLIVIKKRNISSRSPACRVKRRASPVVRLLNDTRRRRRASASSRCPVFTRRSARRRSAGSPDRSSSWTWWARAAATWTWPTRKPPT